MSWAGYNTSIAANRYKQMFITNYLDISGELLVNSGDVSFNNGNLYVAGNVGIGMVANSGYELDVAGDVRNNGKLVVLGDASLNSRLVVGDDITTNKRLFTIGDVSLNGNLFAAFDTSLNGNLRIGKDLTINGRLNVQNYTNTNIINTTVNNYQLIVSEDLSLNGRLLASSDITVNNITIGRGGGGNITNTAVGYQSLYSGTGVGNNVAIGYQSLLLNTGSDNTGVGRTALINIETGSYNTAVGVNSGRLLSTGSNNTFIGYQTTANLPTCGNSTAIGVGATVTASNQVVLGRSTEKVIIPGDTSMNGRLFIDGDSSFNGNLYVGKNIGIGLVANSIYDLDVSGDTRVSGNIFGTYDCSINGNLLVGRSFRTSQDISVNTLTIGRGGGTLATSTAVGYQALKSKTSGNDNTALGYNALTLNTTGELNTAIGSNTMSVGINASNCTAVGARALSNSTGLYNVGVGVGALQNITTGNNNTAVGQQALGNGTSGGNSVAVGAEALLSTTGANNTAIGYQAGTAGIANTTGTYNTYIGYQAQANANNYSDSTAIGAGSIITGSNQVVLGRSTEKVVIPGDTSMNGQLVVNGIGSFNGSLIAVTQTISDNSTKVATTEYARSLVDASLGNYYTKSAIDANIVIKSNIASPTFTGIAVIPTANITTLNTFGDASMNGALRLGKDLTINGRLNVQNYTNTNIINTTVNNYQLIISEDLSLNGRLVVAGGDASFNGNIRAVGNITAAALYASSDYRIKSNIQPLSDTSFSIDLLNPITYLNAKLGRQDIGFIAHEVQEHLPFLVNGEKDGAELQSVNYTGIIGLLTNEIQELKKQNVVLNEKIKNIEERISKNAL